jgi:hypothetical protein
VAIKGSCPRKSTEIVCAHHERLRALEIVEGSLPDFKKSGLDIYVWPGGFDWAMAFIYENDWFGSYFSRCESVTAPSR